MNRNGKQHPIIMSILCALLCTVMTALGMMVGAMLELSDVYQLVSATIAMWISVGIALLIIKKSKILSVPESGFVKSKPGTIKKVVYLIPLFLVEIPPLFYGIAEEMTITLYVVIALFAITVGFHEEIYFRGIVLNYLKVKGEQKAILISSIIFGILHIANALRGKDMTYLLLQASFAFLAGWVLAELFCIIKSLWILIIWHAIHDFIASITATVEGRGLYILLAIQVTLLLGYGIYLTYVRRKIANENP